MAKPGPPSLLLAVLLHGCFNVWTGLGTILRGHYRVHLDARSEGQEERLADRGNSCRILDVRDDKGRPLSAVFARK